MSAFYVIHFILIFYSNIMSTIYKFESSISEKSTIEFYKTTHDKLGIICQHELHSIAVVLTKEQLFELIGSLLRIQSIIKNADNGTE